MLPRLVTFALLVSGAAAAQPDGGAATEVRAALEDQAPVPSRPLGLAHGPVPRAASAATRVEARARIAETARLRAEEALKRGLAPPSQTLPASSQSARTNLGVAGQAASGQAKAEEVKKNYRGKPPRPPPSP